MDKEDAVYIQMQYYSAIKKMKCAICDDMDCLEIIILSEVRERNIVWYHLYVESKNWIELSLFTETQT